MENQTTRGTLKSNEFHPQALSALQFVKEWIANKGFQKTCMLLESMASSAIEGNRTGEVCGETLDMILKGQKVSDRYLLGLAWFLKELDEQDEKQRSSE